MSVDRRELANAIRVLAMDAVQKSKSGHPGMPMGMADLAEVLWNDFLNHNPANPEWANRDRFVLSNGHGSMLLYSLLHLSGYDVSMADIKDFRQLHSKTPGHPEYGYTPGIETTTGPLGQGIANAVGMALAEKILAGQFNQPGLDIVDHHTYAFVGDGCLMEGISHEVCSLAGTLGLGKLIVIYDDNGISIDGKVDGWFTDDTVKRFEAYGWHVVPGVDGHDASAIEAALTEAKSDFDKPTLICARTIIGWGAPNKQDTHGCHGAPLGDEEIAAARQQLGWTHPAFEIPEHVYAGWNGLESGAEKELLWNQTFNEYRQRHPELAQEFERRMAGELSPNWAEGAQAYVVATDASAPDLATRQASLKAIEAYLPLAPELLGGSADLTGSNLTKAADAVTITHDNSNGNYICYGVREFGMYAIMNGLGLHGGFIPFGGTFAVFSDYARNALRMAALMKQRTIFVLTHDSIGLGEDGPTHQPIEHLASLRVMPNMSIWRPCDAVETAVAWKASIENADGPSGLFLSRQKLAHQPRSAEMLANIARGGYVISDSDGSPNCLIIATGSEVEIAVQAQKLLSEKGTKVRVVSMPNTRIFDQQSDVYKQSVLPKTVAARVSIEAGVTDCWAKYVGLDGLSIGIDRFGESAPAGELFDLFGLTPEKVAGAVSQYLAG